MKRSILGAAALAATLAGNVATASDLVGYKTVFDTDLAQAGLGGLRDVGSGTITLGGVSGTVTQALLYWHGPTNSTDPAVNASVDFNGSAIVGTHIGFSDDNFWNFDNSQAYRADVTSLVTGNGSYTLGNMMKAPEAGINGASLIVFYDDGNTANDRDVVIFNGNDANWPNAFDADGWNTTLGGIQYSGGAAALHFHVSDGQNFSPSDDGTLTVNGTAIATGGIFQGDSTPFSTGGVSNGKLWDVKTFDITGLLTNGPNALNIRMDAVNDALSEVVVLVDLPAGAAPPIPEPAPAALLAGGLAVLGWRLRRRRA